MQIKIFTVAYNDQKQTFDTTEMDNFLADKNVLATERHFIKIFDLYVWTIAVEYEWKNAIQRREAYKAQNELEQTLISWRNALAKKKGIPPYLIATNKQIIDMAQKKPKTLKGLEAIRGYGSKKIEEYGKQIIEIVLKHTEDGESGKL